ncbi:MarR family winged helix-turn-helix transcriptional regulator [Actinoplanes sp. NPDC051859]|uniref:MarR family winged helix-turn-helix transcriptional regulator n=1 Tax=Actinoplanes sp. NPDC051859 TaxID=3363909 RepID=UPI003791E2FF
MSELAIDQPPAVPLSDTAMSGRSDDCDAVSVLCRAAHQVRRHLEHTVLHPAGLNWTSYDVLHLVIAHRQIEPQTIAAISGLAKATVTLAAKTLATRQLIRRVPDPGDHRHRFLRPTVSGWQVLHELRPRIRAAQQLLLAGTVEGVPPALLHTAATLTRPTTDHQIGPS